MGIIKAVNLIFDYIRHDEEEDKDEVSHALKGVSLDIKEGDFVAILGHNGSGKSTFAKLMNGILLPTDGTVYISKMRTDDEEHLWDVRKTAGMVFQNPDNQIIGNVVEEDVGFGPENMGVPTEEIWARVDKSLEAVGMTAYRLQSPNKLSGGQKQRVAIAGVMAMKPRCIVLDEPTAMLDPNGRREVIKTVHELNRQEGITVVLITHYMEEVIDADRVVVIDGGHVVMDGTPKEVFSRVKELKKYSLDVPQVTELADELKALNDERKDMTQEGTEAAILQVETELKDDKVLVIFLPDCHESLAGIVAGRIRERYNKPVFVLTRAEGCAKGSGRSIEAYHMFRALVEVKDLLLKFGGHPMAAGFSLEEANIEEFRRRLNENAKERLTEDDFIPRVWIDVPMPFEYITESLIQELELLEPFGQGNEKPQFALKSLKIRSARVFGRNRNVVKLSLMNERGFSMDGVVFTEGDLFMEEMGNSRNMDIIYYPTINEYNGNRSLQLVVKDWKFH